jgi:hypothetical protein
MLQEGIEKKRAEYAFFELCGQQKFKVPRREHTLERITQGGGGV